MTIAFQTPTTYIPASQKAEREAAKKIASTANGDTERLLLTPEERERRLAEAQQVANRATTKLSPEQVWGATVQKVAYMSAEAGHALKEIFPEPVGKRFRAVPSAERKIMSIPGAPHAGLTLIGIVDAGRGREIAIYGGNSGGKVSIKNGVPMLVEIKAADEKTQNEPRYFGVSQQRLENGKRVASDQLLFMDMDNINDVAKRCCELLGVPGPAKKYEYMKDRKAAEAAAKAKPEPKIDVKPVAAHQAQARSLWAKRPDLTIAELREQASRISTPVQQPEARRPAYAM